jgi:hypothetical protein
MLTLHIKIKQIMIAFFCDFSLPEAAGINVNIYGV